eukprot:TRINITY_DN7485_c0_g1_i1.p1 TRINITY_DN7485_c0_g1~~TRINITY_DN7485_c0_g1_i1.p1  ORF type:complete len:268 (-),score=98.20 TRINITY_DN7485_c0_g1_i1:116-838(-)
MLSNFGPPRWERFDFFRQQKDKKKLKPFPPDLPSTRDRTEMFQRWLTKRIRKKFVVMGLAEPPPRILPQESTIEQVSRIIQQNAYENFLVAEYFSFRPIFNELYHIKKGGPMRDFYLGAHPMLDPKENHCAKYEKRLVQCLKTTNPTRDPDAENQCVIHQSALSRCYHTEEMMHHFFTTKRRADKLHQCTKPGATSLMCKAMYEIDVELCKYRNELRAKWAVERQEELYRQAFPDHFAEA